MFSVPFSLSRSTSINKPASEVYKTLSDFNTWKKWSPWLCQEPECPVDVAGEPGKVGHRQEWDGRRIGSGNMRISETEENKSIRYDLEFLKPWKSRSKTAFALRQKGKTTEVAWSMDATLPLFMFWMKKMMIAWVGRDYDRGLAMLKDLLENGEVNSELDIVPEVRANGFDYVGKARTCDIDEIGPLMREDLRALAELVEGGKLPPPDAVLSIYKKFDMVSGRCDYITGFTYKQAPAVQEPGLVTGRAPEHQALQINHKGPYRHLGNGWSTGMSYLRASRKKQSKAVSPYEIYRNDPHKVPEKDLQTEIYFPLR